jgi:pantoate--beta-alanine ligase
MPAPEILHTVDEFRRAADALRSGGGSLGLVPTMGALHEGHAALMREARRRASVTAVTIFVNPTQFGPKEDLARYPRDLAGDVDKCAAEGVSIVFSPDVAEMYPPGERTRVRVSGLTDYLCGASRPGHFEGVATIVTKLFAAAGRCVAVFGRKDYQQLQVIRRMTRDLLLPVDIVGYPIVRESDGLALSSRNAYLSADDRMRALAIPRALSQSVDRFRSGERGVRSLREPVRAALDDAGLRVDYVAITDADELTPFDEGATLGGRALLAVAAFAGNTRLIDNVVYGEDASPLPTK